MGNGVAQNYGRVCPAAGGIEPVESGCSVVRERRSRPGTIKPGEFDGELPISLVGSGVEVNAFGDPGPVPDGELMANSTRGVSLPQQVLAIEQSWRRQRSWSSSHRHRLPAGV